MDSTEGTPGRNVQLPSIEGNIVPFLAFCRFLGLAPYYIDVEKGVYLSLYSMVQTGAIVAFNIAAAVFAYKTKAEDTSFHGIAVLLEVFFFATVTIFSHINSLYRGKRRAELLLQLLIYMSVLKNVQTIKNRINMFLFAELGFTITIILILYLSPIYYLIKYNLVTELELTQYIMLYFYTFFIYMIECQFSNLVLLLTECYKGINDTLKIMLDDIISQPFSTDYNPNASVNVYDENNDFVQTIPMIEDPDEFTNRLKIIRVQYYNISEIGSELSNIFSFQMLTSLLIIFLEIAYNIFFFIAHILATKVGGVGESTKTSFFSAYSIPWTLYYITKLCLLGGICDFAVKEAKYSGVLIHRIINRTKSEDIKSEMKQLSLQILYHPLKFTAAGVVPIDLTVACAIVGSVTTYLVILIQFQIQSALNHRQSMNSINSTFLIT